MFLSHPVWKLLFHTPIKRQTGYSWFAIPISTIPVTKHPLFLKISLSLFPNVLLCSFLPNFLLLLSPICPHEAMDLSPPECSALLPPPEFSAPPLPDLSSWSHGSLSPEGFSSIEVWKIWGLKVLIWDLIWVLKFRFSIEVWRLKDLGFESVDLRSDLGLKIWVLFGFGNMFEVGVLLYLWGFGWFC